MAYEIVMPQLSDSMDEGKLISWKVKEGDYVHKGDVIAEVESDKAIMEVQSFKSGVVKRIHLKEGEVVPVGDIIVTIDTQESATDVGTKPVQITPTLKTVPASQSNTKVQKKKAIPKILSKQETKHTPNTRSFLDDILGLHEDESIVVPPKVKGDASPKAKALAAKYKLDIEVLQKEHKLPLPAHKEDVLRYFKTHHFTPKALALLDLYHLDASLFTEDKKHDSATILSYIQTHDIVLPQKIDVFQSALISAVEESAKKPVFHIYDAIDTSLLQRHKEYTMTVWLIKLFAKAMMQHEHFRATLKNDTILTSPNASLSLAIMRGEYLYMPVFKDANLLSLDALSDQLKSYEQKAETKNMRSSDMQGGTFGISNLGMLGIARFDAMINKNESGIAAIGAMKNDKITITLTLDHRLINGYEGAQFMQTLKALSLDAQFFKDV